MNFKYHVGLVVATILFFIAIYGLSGLKTKETLGEEKDTNTKHLNWSYGEENGPMHWADLDSSYLTCSKGTKQSPIDIDPLNTQQETFEEIEMVYKPSNFTLINNGHTIQANDSLNENLLLVDGESFVLEQMHFHYPAEHQMQGQSYAMEGHLVHSDPEGNLAVLGFFIEEGNENQELSKLWSAFPTKKSDDSITVNDLVNLANVFPEKKSGFQYIGSLTTPPCSEEVNWLILEQPIEMSAEQIAIFASIFSNNSRPIQSLNDRDITEMELQ